MRRLLLFFMFYASSQIILCQDLESYRWKNRVIIVCTDSESNVEYLNQIAELNNDIKGVIDRRIIIYLFSKKNYSVGFKKEFKNKYTNNFQTKVKEMHPFTIQLIGLDGEVKLTSKTHITFNSLKQLIDSMPMRKLELGKVD